MKTMRVVLGASFMLAAACATPAAITFSSGGSSWTGGGTFDVTGAMLTGGVSPSGAYYGSSQPDANTFLFGLVNNPTPTNSPSDFNLASGTSVVAGTTLNLTFTGLAAVPDYVAYTGGALTAYSYNSGTLSLTVSTINPVASHLDPSGSTLGSAFGLMIVSGTGHNFGGTVFQTDMFWQDIQPLQAYAGTHFAAGLNAYGENGTAASFYAYMPTALLNANGITAPAQAEARLQKNGVSSVLLGGLSIDVFTAVNPGFPNEGTVWTWGGASGLNFDGVTGSDDYVLAAYTNSSWSDGNIGIAAIPEPATYAALLGSLALLAASRRRALNNATMR